MTTDAALEREAQTAKTAHYSSAVEANGLVFTAGQLALDGESRIVGEGIEAQTRRTLENLTAVLHERELALRDVIKVTVWLRQACDFHGFNRVYGEMFGDNRPARTTVVAELVLPTALIELEAVAAR
ncbi:MAG TPA: RidA family protein [Caulobacteraceae bacterium]|jgi:2-iminobutanoate/2-iminopropanoate deaminase|nr:RidA family protein [Caulobacteraceae bacterium]